jgi:hypothetical protein
MVRWNAGDAVLIESLPEDIPEHEATMARGKQGTVVMVEATMQELQDTRHTTNVPFEPHYEIEIRAGTTTARLHGIPESCLRPTTSN